MDKATQYLVLKPMTLNIPENLYEKPRGSIFIAYNDKKEALKQSEGKFQIHEIEITSTKN